jgi:hypothetical protein
MNDDQLTQMLDEKALWLVRGGNVGVLGPPFGTLREALHRAHDLWIRGNAPGPIVQGPDDNVIVPNEQIYRLWQSLGLSVR